MKPEEDTSHSTAGDLESLPKGVRLDSPGTTIHVGALVLCRDAPMPHPLLVRRLRFAHCFGEYALDPDRDEETERQLAVLTENGLLARPSDSLTITDKGLRELEELETAIDEAAQALAGQVRHALGATVDSGQARMFADRIAALRRILARMRGFPSTDAEARLLDRVFVLRLRSFLDRPPDARVRLVRDLVDLIYTRAAVVRYREANRGAPRHIRREHVEWRTVRRGIAAASVEMRLRNGPILAHMLRVDTRKATLRAVDASRLPIEQRSFPALARRFGGLEATSGGFFLYSEPDIEAPQQRGDPVGLLVQDGEVLAPPLFARAALIITDKGHVFMREVPLKGTRVIFDAAGDPQILLRSANRPRSAPGEVPAFTRAYGPHTPPGCGRTVTIVRRRIVSVGRDQVPIPLLGIVLAFPDGSIADKLVASLKPGVRVRYVLASAPGEGRVLNAMAGGPMLVRDGRVAIDLTGEEFLPGVPPVTFAEDGAVGYAMLPRLAYGILPNHQVVAVAVDGRNLTHSVGETLDGMARTMLGMGCVHAANFDGGSSKRMCIDGEVVDLSTTSLVEGKMSKSAPARPISSAWVVESSAPGRRTEDALGD